MPAYGLSDAPDVHGHARAADVSDARHAKFVSRWLIQGYDINRIIICIYDSIACYALYVSRDGGREEQQHDRA